MAELNQDQFGEHSGEPHPFESKFRHLGIDQYKRQQGEPSPWAGYLRAEDWISDHRRWEAAQGKGKGFVDQDLRKAKSSAKSKEAPLVEQGKQVEKQRAIRTKQVRTGRKMMMSGLSKMGLKKRKTKWW